MLDAITIKLAQAANYAAMTTLFPNGNPQTQVMWIDADDEFLFVNTEVHREKYKNVEILWASTREPYNFLQAKKLKCHIITVPPSIILKIEKFGKSFQKLTIDTVKGFLLDSKKSNFRL